LDTAEEIDQICPHKQFFRSEQQERNPEQDFGQIEFAFTSIRGAAGWFSPTLLEESPRF